MRPSNEVNPNQMLFVMQIISASMILGILMFLGIGLVITQDQEPKQPYLAYIGLGFAALAIVGQFLFRLPVDTSRLTQSSEAEPFDPHSDEVFSELAPKYQAELIVRMAILEAAAFFNGVVYIVEKIWWSPAVMVLIVFLMLFRFPTHTRIHNWIERKTLALQFGRADF